VIYEVIKNTRTVVDVNQSLFSYLKILIPFSYILALIVSFLLQSFLRTTSNILDQTNKGSWKALEENNETKVGAIIDLGL